MKHNTVIALCGDPGGANAVAPVIEALRTENATTVKLLAYRQAQTLWGKRFSGVEVLSENTTQMEAFALLNDSCGEILLTGTSLNLIDLEKVFIAAARQAEIPSLAVLDSWSNYRKRFSDNKDRLVYLPDLIAIMDERAYNEMLIDGFDSERLVITGHPALEELGQWRAKLTPMRREKIRKVLQISPEEQMIVFASQPLSRFYGVDPSTPGHLGYTEQKVLKLLLIALRSITEQSDLKLVLVIRPHPSEDTKDFKGVSCGQVRTIVSTEGNSRDLLMAADVITGMNTMLLMEASYLGCLTVSLQPGLRLPDVLPTNRSGQSIPIYQEQEIEPVMKKLLTNKQDSVSFNYKPRSLQFPCGATRRVVQLVYQMMGLDK